MQYMMNFQGTCNMQHNVLQLYNDTFIIETTNRGSYTTSTLLAFQQSNNGSMNVIIVKSLVSFAHFCHIRREKRDWSAYMKDLDHEAACDRSW